LVKPEAIASKELDSYWRFRSARIYGGKKNQIQT